MSSITVRYYQIPAYLRCSEFYRNLNWEIPNDKISIPADCFSFGHEIDTMEDFVSLLRVMNFWMVDRIPASIVKFCHLHSFSCWNSIATDIWQKHDATFQDLRNVFEGVRRDPLSIIRAMQANRKDIVRGLIGEWKSHWLEYSIRDEFDKEVMTAVARLGYLRYFALLHKKGFRWGSNTCAAAASNGNLRCLIYAHEHGCPWDHEVYVEAVRGGHMHCIQYAHEQGLPWHVDVCTAAVKCGQLNRLQYVRHLGCPWDENVLYEAASLEDPNIFNYAIGTLAPIHGEMCSHVAGLGKLEHLALLHTHGAFWSAATAAIAAGSGHFACLQYLYGHGCPWDERTTTAAVCAGHLTIIRYAFDHDCPHDNRVLRRAAAKGDLLCLQYLVELGLYMDAAVFGEALAHGERACMEYLVDMGCPYVDATCEKIRKHENLSSVEADSRFLKCFVYAVERGWKASVEFIQYLLIKDMPQCYKYLHEEGLHTAEVPEVPPICTKNVPRAAYISKEESDRACRVGDLDALRFLHKQGAQWGISSMAAAVEGGHMHCVVVLRDLGCPWDETITEAATRGGHYDMLSYMLQCGCPCNLETLVLAAGAPSQPCLQLLAEHFGIDQVQNENVFKAAFTGARLACMKYLAELGCKVGSVEFHAPLDHLRPWPHDLIDSEFSLCIDQAIRLGWKWNSQFLDYLRECKYTISLGRVVDIDRSSVSPNESSYQCPLGQHDACAGHTYAALLAEAPPSVEDGHQIWNHVCAVGCLECARSLYDQWVPWNEEASAAAARSGKLECVEYLFEHGCPWDARTMHAAAQGGHLEILQFARRRECPNTDDSMSLKLALTAPVNNLACARYLIEDGSIVLDEDGSVFGVAFVCADLPCVQYLFEVNCPFENFRFVFDPNIPHVIVSLHKDAEFAECISTAVHRGWEFDLNLVHYVWHYDLAQCIDYFMTEWHLPPPLSPNTPFRCIVRGYDVPEEAKGI